MKKIGRLIVWIGIFVLSMLGAYMGWMEQEKAFFIITIVPTVILLILMLAMGVIEWRLTGYRGYIRESIETIILALLMIAMVWLIAFFRKKDFYEVFQWSSLWMTILIPIEKKEEE